MWLSSVWAFHSFITDHCAEAFEAPIKWLFDTRKQLTNPCFQAYWECTARASLTVRCFHFCRHPETKPIFICIEFVLPLGRVQGDAAQHRRPKGDVNVTLYFFQDVNAHPCEGPFQTPILAFLSLAHHLRCIPRMLQVVAQSPFPTGAPKT